MDDAPETLRFEDLLEHAGFLKRVALRLVGSGAAADDVVQDTWLAAMRRPPARREGLRRWLGTTARRVVSGRERAETRRAGRERSQARRPHEVTRPGEGLEREELLQALTRAICALPEPSRRVVFLRFFEERDATSIGEELGIPAATVRTRLRRALAQLRHQLGFDDREVRERWRHGVALAFGVPAMKSSVSLSTAAIALVLLLGAGGFWIHSRAPRPEPEAAPRHEEARVSMPEEILTGRPDVAPIETSPLAPAEADMAPSVAAETATLRVRVTTAEGTPVPGTALALAHGKDGLIFARAETNTDGTAALPLRLAAHRLIALAPGHAPHWQEIPDGASAVDVRLQGGTSIAGRVVVDGAAPDHPLRLRLLAPERQKLYPEDVTKFMGDCGRSAQHANEALTDANGAFRFEGLPTNARCWIVPPAHLEEAKRANPQEKRNPFDIGFRWATWKKCEIAARAGDGAVLLELTSRRHVSGIPVATRDGAAGAYLFADVRFETPDGLKSEYPTMLTEGKAFQLLLPDNALRCVDITMREFNGPQFAHVRIDGKDLGPGRFDLGEVHQVAERGLAIEVVDPDDRPLPGTWIAAGGAISGRSDARGRWKATLPVGTTEILAFHESGLAGRSPEIADDEVGPIRLRLAPSSRLELHFEGDPRHCYVEIGFTGALHRIEGTGAGALRRALARPQASGERGSGNQHWRRWWCPKDRPLVLESVAEDEPLRIRLHDASGLLLREEELRLRRAEKRSLHWTVAPPERGLSFAFEDDLGVPLSGVTVSDGGAGHWTSDAEGRLRLPPTRARTRNIWVSREGHVSRFLRDQTMDSLEAPPRRLVLSRARELLLTITATDHAPLDAQQVVVLRERDEPLHFVRLAPGSFRLARAPRSQLRVRVTRAGVEREFEIPPGTTEHTCVWE